LNEDTKTPPTKSRNTGLLDNPAVVASCSIWPAEDTVNSVGAPAGSHGLR